MPVHTLDVALPKPPKGQDPRKTITLTASTKTSFVNNPGDGFNASAQGLTKNTAPYHTAVKLFSTWH
jgi:hypothetical protein